MEGQMMQIMWNWGQEPARQRMWPSRAAWLTALVMLCFGAAGCGTFAAKGTEDVEVVDHRAFYICPRTMSPISIDGSLGEKEWEYAQLVREFSLPPEHRVPTNATRAWITWDSRFLYVAFDATDPDINAIRTERDSQTHKDDVLEFFFKTDPEEPDYYNIEINAMGAFLDSYHSPGRRLNKRWNCSGIKVGVNVEGTLNVSSDQDRGWTLEVAIPFASLPTLDGAAPEPGDVWLFHFARIDRSHRLEENRELISSAPLATTWFHNYEKWLPLVFAGPRFPSHGNMR